MTPRTGRNTRERLLGEGLAAFFEQGYHGTGIQQIVDAAQVPKGSFYNHFESKEELATTCIATYAEAVGRRLARRFQTEDGRSALEKLDGLLEELTRVQEGVAGPRGCLLANLAAEVSTTSPELREAARAGFESWRGPLADLFARGQAEGSVRRDLPAAELADFLLDVWEGALLRMKMEGGSTRALEERRRQLVSFFLPARPATPSAGEPVEA